MESGPLFQVLVDGKVIEKSKAFVTIILRSPQSKALWHRPQIGKLRGFPQRGKTPDGVVGPIPGFVFLDGNGKYLGAYGKFTARRKQLAYQARFPGKVRPGEVDELVKAMHKVIGELK